MNETKTRTPQNRTLSIAAFGIVFLLTATCVVAQTPAPVSAPFTVAIVEDFTDLGSRPILTPELMERLAGLGGERGLKVVYTVVAEHAAAAPVPLDLTPPPAIALPEEPDPKLPYRKFEEQARLFLEATEKARTDMDHWLRKQQEAIEALKSSVLETQVRTESGFVAGLAKNHGKDYRRSAVAAAVKLVCATAPDAMVILSDGVDLPADGAPQKGPVREIPGKTHLIFVHPRAAESPLFATLPNGKTSCTTMATALDRVAELVGATGEKIAAPGR